MRPWLNCASFSAHQLISQLRVDWNEEMFVKSKVRTAWVNVTLLCYYSSSSKVRKTQCCSAFNIARKVKYIMYQGYANIKYYNPK